MTRDSRASFVGTLLFILNPNILYLQTTPLSELVFIATLTAACYYFLAWAQDGNPKQLIWVAASTFLATIARYDGWPLFLTFLIFIVINEWIRHRRLSEIVGSLFVFGTLGGLGIGLWLLWCGIIFGDPLYFQRGPYSAQAQQKYFIQEHLLYTYHNLWQSIRYFMIGSMVTLGPLLFVLSIIAVLIFVFRRRITLDMFAALAFLVPFAFYIASLYSGQAAFFVPQAVPANAPYPLFNTRYAVMAVPPAALFLSTLAGIWHTRVGRRILLDLRTLWHVVLLIVVVAQSAWIAYTGIITLQDGEYGLSCEPQHPAVIYLAQHYAGGRILEDLYTSKIAEPEMGVDFKNFVYEGSGELWQKSLDDPAAIVDWIIIDQSNPADLVALHFDVKSPQFLSEFTLAVQEQDGIVLYHRDHLHPLPTRPIPPDLPYAHLLCRAGVPGQHSKVFVGRQARWFTKHMPPSGEYGRGSKQVYSGSALQQ